MKPGATKRPRRSTMSVPLPESLRMSALVPTASTVVPRTARASTSGRPGSPVQTRPFDEDAVGLSRPIGPRGACPAPSDAARAAAARTVHATRHGRPPFGEPGRHGPGTSVSTCTAGPGRKGVFSPFAQAACPSA